MLADTLATLVAHGVTEASFHADGSIAHVRFSSAGASAPEAESAPPYADDLLAALPPAARMAVLEARAAREEQ